MAVSKQLLPIYDKPMIYYPLSVLMLSEMREITIITTPQDRFQFIYLLGDGSQWGISLTYIEQPNPEGLAQAYILAKDFLNGAPSALILGDNIFFGQGLTGILSAANKRTNGGTVFGCHVADPERYRVVEFDEDGKVISIIEKPAIPPSNYAVTGLYFLDGDAPRRAKKVTPSERGELEIVSLLEDYRNDGLLSIETMGRGFAWLDTGTHASLLEAENFVRTLSERQGVQVGSPDEVAFRNGWIDKTQLASLGKALEKNAYGQYLTALSCNV